MPTEKPQSQRGREQVRAALVAAADDLFGAKGPDQVSVRDVAARAGVNHALLHRHFGSKEQLLHDVLVHHAAQFRSSAEGVADPGEAVTRMFEVMTAQPAFMRILAHLRLSGEDFADHMVPDGGLKRLVEAMHGGANNDARLTAAMSVALCMGWTLFEDFLLRASACDHSPETARIEVGKRLQDFINFLDK